VELARGLRRAAWRAAVLAARLAEAAGRAVWRDRRRADDVAPGAARRRGELGLPGLWLRDASLRLEALVRLGFRGEARAFFWWLTHATRRWHPRLSTLFRVDGSDRVRESEPPAATDRGRLHRQRRGRPAPARRLRRPPAPSIATRVGEPDSDTGRRSPSSPTSSRARGTSRLGHLGERGERRQQRTRRRCCWVALHRAAALAARGAIPDRRERWQAEAARIRTFVEERCWDAERRAYTRYAGGGELDAGVVALPLFGYCDAGDGRMLATLDAVRRELGAGPLLARYGSPTNPHEGAFRAVLAGRGARPRRPRRRGGRAGWTICRARERRRPPGGADSATAPSSGTSRRGSRTSRS
jgi:hypothetical protein